MFGWILALIGLIACIFWAAVLRFNKQTRETPGDPRKYVAFVILILGVSLALLPLDGWHIGHLAMLTGMIAAPLAIGFAMIWGTDQNLTDVERQAVEENLSRKEKWQLRKHSYVPGTIAIVAALCSAFVLMPLMPLPGTPPFWAWWVTLTFNIMMVLVAYFVHKAEWSGWWLYWLVMPLVILSMATMSVFAIITTWAKADSLAPESSSAVDIVEATKIDQDCPRQFRLDEDSDGEIDPVPDNAPADIKAMGDPESLIDTMEDADIWEEGEYTVYDLVDSIGNTLCLNNTAAWYALAEKFPNDEELTAMIDEELEKRDLPSVEEYLAEKE